MSYILITGGAGYIGSHTAVELVNNGYKIVVVDNLVNSSYDSIARLEVLLKQNIPFFKVDLNDSAALEKVFQLYNIGAVLHFAALKAVGESTKIPLNYYANNVGGTISLLEVMKKYNCYNFVFSSSATVYGDATRFPNMIPIPENCPTGPTNPYGQTKIIIENLLRDVYAAEKEKWNIAILRYFNPIGAHPSGLIGEDPLGIPNNLLPFLAQVAIGKREKLYIFGNDYDSKDGTPIRDYIHVVDLAKGHIAALNYLFKTEGGICREWNLGTGGGSTVIELYNSFCKAVGRQLPYEIVGRRDGDVLNLTAVSTRANTELKWRAELSVDDACRDLWNWTTKNPSGFSLDNYSWTLFSKLSQSPYESRLHKLVSPDGRFEFSISNYGATIVSCKLDGKELQLGFKDEEGYRKYRTFFGATVGRVANRIEAGKIELDNVTYQLPLNEANINTIHGGPTGYNSRYFLGPIASKDLKTNESSLEFVYVDEHGSNGFPGTLNVHAKFTLKTENTPKGGEMELQYWAELTPDSPVDQTYISMTNHVFFNIGQTPTTEDTEISVASNKMLEVNKYLIPSGKYVTFDALKTFEDSSKTTFTDVAPVIDNYFVLSDSFSIDTRSKPLVKFAEAYNPHSEIKLTAFTTEPGFQIYTADRLNAPGVAGSRGGFCLEASRFIDAANRDEWKKSVTLSKGEQYGATISYRFEK